MLEEPINTSPKNVEIVVVNGMFIKCGSKGGNLRVKSKTPGNEPLQIRWYGEVPFQLQFFAVPLEDDPAPSTPAWPFREPAPAACLTDLSDDQTFTVKDTNIVCKYSVYVDTLHHDPIIIVEK